jgi:uncharacterized membrane protein
MTTCAHLWAVGFDDIGLAAKARDAIGGLAREQHDFKLLDVALAVRYPDGSLTLNGVPFPCVTKIHQSAFAQFLACLTLGAPPLSAAAVDAMYARIGADMTEVGITDDFVRGVADLIKLGTSVLFVLDDVEDIDAILGGIRGLGGTVLKTNVDLERAQLIQSTLAASADTVEPDGRQIETHRQIVNS